MRFQAIARVEGDGILSAPLEVQEDGYTMTLRPGPDGRIAEIRVSRAVLDYAADLPQIGRLPDGRTHIDIRSRPQLNDIVGLLQHIESIGSFFCGIKRIYWESAAFEWLAESPDEQRVMSVKGFSQDYALPQPGVTIVARSAAELLSRRHERKSLILPMAFFREGMNEFGAHRFLYAFINFYLVLDDVCGQGKIKTADVLKAFRANQALVAAVQWTLRRIETNAPHHRPALAPFFAAEKCTWSVDGTLQLLVSMRGNLFHFSQRSTKFKGTPFNQAQLESLAFLLMGICLSLIPQLMSVHKPGVQASGGGRETRGG
jgi:hypothetical protein